MSNINPSLLENVFTVTYRYAPDVSGGTPYYKPLINITNVDSINVNTLTYSNIAFGDAFGNMFVGDQAGANGTNRSNVNGLGEQAVDYSDNIRNVNVLGFSAMNQADDLSNVVGVGTYVGSNMSNVSNSIFLGDFVAGELSNTSGEIFIGTRVAENLVASDGQNIVIGNEGLNTATSIGRGNILMGAGVATSGLTPGSSNVVIGTGSAPNLTTDASANVILGAASGLNIVNGSNNILIGYEVDPPADTSDYLQIGNLIRGSQSISYVSIMTDISRTGCLTLGNNTIIYPPGDATVISNLSARLILGPAPNTTGIAYSSVIENLTVSFASGYHSKLNFYTHPTALGTPSLAMTIDETQRVGIGTNAPQYALDISASAAFPDRYAFPPPGQLRLKGDIANLYIGAFGDVSGAGTEAAATIQATRGPGSDVVGVPINLNPAGGRVGIGLSGFAFPEATLDISGGSFMLRNGASNTSGWEFSQMEMNTGSGQRSVQFLVDTDNSGFGNLSNIYASYVYPATAQARGTSLLTQYSLISDGVVTGLSAGDVVFPYTVMANQFVGMGTSITQKYTSPGTYSISAPQSSTGFYALKCLLVGGGGGGAGTTATSGGGGGGAAGYQNTYELLVLAGQTISFTVGTGGSGGSPGNLGTNGTSSTLLTIAAAGGGGGSVATLSVGGDGGLGSFGGGGGGGYDGFAGGNGGSGSLQNGFPGGAYTGGSGGGFGGGAGGGAAVPNAGGGGGGGVHGGSGGFSGSQGSTGMYGSGGGGAGSGGFSGGNGGDGVVVLTFTPI